MLKGFVPYPDAFVEGYRQKGLWVDKTIGEELDGAVARYGDKIALACEGRYTTYRELGERATRLALHFVEKGLRSYDRVILQLPNELEFAYCFYAAVKIGAIPIMALPAHRGAEITFFAQFNGAKAHIMPAQYKDFSHQTLSREVREKALQMTLQFVSGGPVEEGFVSISALLEDRIEERMPAGLLADYRPEPLQPGLFQLSGGTTGVPKIIPRTHNDYSLNFKAIGDICALTEESVLGIAIPVGHNFALACPGLLGGLYKGAKVVLIPTPKTETVLNAIQKEKITIMPTPPALLIRWMEFPQLRDYDLSSLRYVIAGGARLNSEVAKKIGPVLGCEYFQNLGMGEGMGFWSRIGDGEDLLLNTQGAPIFDDDEIRVVDENEKEVPYGEPGELLVRGPITIRGYYNSPEYNEKAFTADGFYRTGDVAKMYKGRYLSVEGRIKDTINRGAEKINAEEVENHIFAHPDVENCAFVAMPDRVLGEKGCAFVRTKSGKTLTLPALQAFLRDERNITIFKLPERLEMVEAFPMTNVGKIDKKELRRIITEKLALESEKAGK